MTSHGELHQQREMVRELLAAEVQSKTCNHNKAASLATLLKSTQTALDSLNPSGLLRLDIHCIPAQQDKLASLPCVTMCLGLDHPWLNRRVNKKACRPAVRNVFPELNAPAGKPFRLRGQHREPLEVLQPANRHK